MGESTPHTSLPGALIAYIEGLVLAQGRYAGEPFILDTWQKAVHPEGFRAFRGCWAQP